MNEPQSDDIDAGDLAKRLREQGHTVTKIRFRTFAERLKGALIAKNIGTWRVAAALEVSGQMVGKYLRGESMPAISKLPKLADLLEMPLDELLQGTPVSPDDVVRRRNRNLMVGLVTADGRSADVVRGPGMLTNGREKRVPGMLTGQFPGESDRSVGDRIREVVFYRTREKLESVTEPEPSDYSGPESRRPLPAKRLVKGPIDEGRYFDLRPDMAFASPSGWRFAIEVKTGRPSLESLVGFATNWKESTAAPLFLVIAKLRSPSEQIGLFDYYDDYDEALIGTSMEPGRHQPPASLVRPPLPRRYIWALDEMARSGLFKGVSVVYYNRQTDRLSDSFSDVFGLDAMLEQVSETALT
jgi:transcriptional regulator with XRE-family HTH domain